MIPHSGGETVEVKLSLGKGASVFGLAEKPWFRKSLITMVGSPHLRAFNKQSKNLKATQESVLQGILKTCSATAFGRDHGLGQVKTVTDFRKAVPIGDFERHRPYVDRMCRGEENVLFPGKPIIYNTTSGTTGKPKMIPLSKSYFERAVGGISKLWLYTCLRDNPHIYDGKSLSAVSTAEEGFVEDGTPYGSVSGLTYKNIPNVLKSTYSTPYAVICIPDYLKKYYAMMRCALACDITFIISPSPSNQLKFHQTAVEHFEDIVRDIRDGTLRGDVLGAVPEECREEVSNGFSPDSTRAHFLEKLMEKHGDNLRPKHYWPNLALVNSWVQGNFSLVLPKLSGYYPESTVTRAFGYQASEGRLGVVLGNDWDYSVLTAGMYFFEFIPIEERDSADPVVLEAHEVEIGRKYYIVFSHESGLFRYDINDIIEVIGHYNGVPTFRFIQKGDGITNLTGEKLSEEQVIQGVKEAADDAGTRVLFYVMTADNSRMQYDFFAEFEPGTDTKRKKQFLDSFDTGLRRLNREYEGKRGSGRLAKPDLVSLESDSEEHLKEKLVSLGMAREGQYKEIRLTADAILMELLRDLAL